MRRNGFEVKRINARKATPIAAWTESTRARRRGGRLPPNHAAMAPKSATISTQSSIEPSWLPHVPLILYSIGLAEWLLATTSCRLKSEVMKAHISAPKDRAMRMNCAAAAGSAIAIQAARPRQAPHIGTTICTRATPKASTSAKCPSSVIMGRTIRGLSTLSHGKSNLGNGQSVAVRRGSGATRLGPRCPTV